MHIGTPTYFLCLSFSFFHMKIITGSLQEYKITILFFSKVIRGIFMIRPFSKRIHIQSFYKNVVLFFCGITLVSVVNPGLGQDASSRGVFWVCKGMLMWTNLIHHKNTLEMTNVCSFSHFLFPPSLSFILFLFPLSSLIMKIIV